MRKLRSMSKEKRPTDKSVVEIRKELTELFNIYFNQTRSVNGRIRMALPIAIFLSGIAYDTHDDSEMLGSWKEGIFKHLRSIEIFSTSTAKHSISKVGPLSFVQFAPVSVLNVVNVPSEMNFNYFVCHQLTSLSIEKTPFNMDSISTNWPFLQFLSIKYCNVKRISPFVFVCCYLIQNIVIL